MATITGQRVSSLLPGRDTPRDADRKFARGELAETEQSARSAWRSVTPLIAGTPHVRISRDGGRTYPARHIRPLPADPPGQPSTVPVYDPGTGTGRMLVLDLDASRCAAVADVDHQAAELSQLLDRLGARCIIDVSPSGGRHVYVLFAAPLPWLEQRDLCRAMALRFPVIDVAPMSSLGGQISPPGSRHKSGGWRTLTTPLSAARTAVEHPNGPEVWAGLLTEFAAELQVAGQSSGDVGAPGSAPTSELDDTGLPWVPRLGGRANLGPELDRVARTGRWNQTHYPGRSEARMAVLGACAGRGWQLADVRAAVASGAWKGLAALYERRSEPGRFDRLLPYEWRKTIDGISGRKTYAIGTLATSIHAPR